MFRDYIYLDTDRILRYATKIGVNKLEGEEKNGIEERLFEEFEYKLEQEHIDDDFIKILKPTKEELEKVHRQMIIKFESELLIPKEFGEVDFIKKVLSNENVKSSLSQTLSKEDPSIPKNFINSLIKDRGNVPIYFDIDEYKIHSNLQGIYFREGEYADFEENVQERVMVVAKVDSLCMEKKNIVLYNIYRDLLGLGREMRRSIINKGKTKNDIPEEITIQGKAIKVSVLAIYK